MNAVLGILFALLLAFAAILSAAATAVRSVSHAWLLEWVEQRLRGAGAAEVYLERPHRLLHAAGVAGAWAMVLAGVIVALLAGGSVIAAIVGLLLAGASFLYLGQLLPSVVAIHSPTHQLPVVLPVLRVVERLFAPFVASRRPGEARRRAGTPAPDSGREEIEELLREGELEGIGDRSERVVITGVLDFGARPVSAVMRAREEIFALDERLAPLELARRVAVSAYSRVPVYRGSLDSIVGMIHAFDLLKLGGERMPPLRPVLTIDPDRRCSELLFEMLRKSAHMAIVVDPHGRTVGLVTAEDLLEELVGDIHDEHDEPVPPRAEATA